MKKIVVIDYGLSNLKSVKRAFEYCGAEIEITSKKDVIMKAEKLVLPGVGAFEDGMKGLERLELIDVLKEKVSQGVPLLGICLGMQMLLDESDENGLHNGLGLIHGRVEKIPSMDINDNPQCVPHISWGKLYIPSWKSTFTHEICIPAFEGEETYFIHSFEAKCANPDNCIAVAHYGGREISAIIARDNIIGTQFHPEKSGKVGLEIIKRYIEMNGRN